MKDINFINNNFINNNFINNIGIIVYKEYLRPLGFLYSKLKTELFRFGKENSNIPLSTDDLFYFQNTLLYPGTNSTCVIQKGTNAVKGFCTAHSLIKDDEENCVDASKYSIVLSDFINVEPAERSFYISNTNIYDIENVCKIRNQDLVSFEIRESLGSSNFVNLTTTDEISVNDKVFYLGYPLGTPLKKVSGIIKDIEKDYIITNCESFHGSSGAPLFKVGKDNEVQLIGIMSKTTGSEDHDLDNNIIKFSFDKENDTSTAVRLDSKLLNF